MATWVGKLSAARWGDLTGMPGALLIADAGAPKLLTMASAVAAVSNELAETTWPGWRDKAPVSAPPPVMLVSGIPEGLSWRDVPAAGTPEMLALLAEMLDGADVPGCLADVSQLGKAEASLAIGSGVTELRRKLPLDAMHAVVKAGAAPELARKLEASPQLVSVLTAMCVADGQTSDAQELCALAPGSQPPSQDEAALKLLTLGTGMAQPAKAR